MQLSVIALAMMTQSLLGQEAKPSSDTMRAVPMERTEADALFSDYTFRDGEKLPQLRIHYVTLGHKHLNARGEVDNAVLLLHWTNASSQALVTPEFQRALFAPGSPLDVSRYFIIIPDDIGHGRSSKPSNGLKASFPHYGYGDMVDLQHKLVTDSLQIEHLHAVIGMSMGCMNAWQWAEAYPEAVDGIMPIACFPAPISGRNLLWRRLLIDTLHADPAWNGGNYETQPPSAQFAFELARMMIDGVPALQQEVRTPEEADALLRNVSSQTKALDVNDLLYAFDSSRDFNAEPDLSTIKARVFALNFEDDEFYRDSLGVLESDIRLVPHGREVVQRQGPGSVGHLTMSHPGLWRTQVEAFMSSLDKDDQHSQEAR